MSTRTIYFSQTYLYNSQYRKLHSFFQKSHVGWTSSCPPLWASRFCSTGSSTRAWRIMKMCMLMYTVPWTLFIKKHHWTRTCPSIQYLVSRLPFCLWVPCQIGETLACYSSVSVRHCSHYSESRTGTVGEIPLVWVMLSLATLEHGPKHIHQKPDSFTLFQEKRKDYSLASYIARPFRRISHFIYLFMHEGSLKTATCTVWCILTPLCLRRKYRTEGGSSSWMQMLLVYLRCQTHGL